MGWFKALCGAIIVIAAQFDPALNIVPAFVGGALIGVGIASMLINRQLDKERGLN